MVEVRRYGEEVVSSVFGERLVVSPKMEVWWSGAGPPISVFGDSFVHSPMVEVRRYGGGGVSSVFGESSVGRRWWRFGARVEGL